MNNIITENWADDGAGIICKNGSDPLIINNVIVGNSAEFGAGILCDGESAPTIINSSSINSLYFNKV